MSGSEHIRTAIEHNVIIIAIVAGLSLLSAGAGNAKEANKGFPSAESAKDLKEKFLSPPKGYGNVPFYWWNGDSLVRERLADQLGILSDAHTDGLSVSYIHSHPKIDVELNANGYGSFGKADPGKPGVFTDGWWDTWNWFAGQCAEKGIGLGLDDYVVGWEKNGYYVDEILADPSFRNYNGRLRVKKHELMPGETIELSFDEEPISLAMYPAGEEILPMKNGEKLTAVNNTGETQTLFEVSASPSHELHPDYGKRIVECYFGRFDERLDDQARGSMNYFFQDELHYDLNIHSWAEDMPEEFMKRKGYDVRPYLAALFVDIGAITPKVRLDYADVVTQLSEERYFKPIFDWHNDRGIIYGCDNNGRGLEPLQYMDYFRMTSWFTAPGNDAPARGSSFRQTKVSSSISHLYDRPRTWLEAFHSMGWDSNGEWLTSQLDHHMIAGGNLLCMHGLYYSTHGGWWEWAPPCFHFRMPYWPHMKKWLEYAERLSYLLSQGGHVCDIAVLYPTETLQAYGGTPDRIWAVSDLLSASGLDYDFVDYHSLADAVVKDGEIEMGKERYKVLILPDVKAMHFTTLEKILEFSSEGGIVISTDDSLRATSRKGENDPEALDMWKSVFANPSGRCIMRADTDSIPALIRSMLTPDFASCTGKGTVLHRRIDDRDVYMVMNVQKGDELFFRSHGKVEIWNAKDGSVVPQPILRQDGEGTYIRHEGEPGTSRLYVFSPGNPIYRVDSGKESQLLVSVPVEGEWDIEIIPTMDNKWGDFRLPATDGLIGPEAREFECTYTGKGTLNGKATSDLYGFGPMMELKVLDPSEDIDAFLKGTDVMKDAPGWEPYVFSWQYGVRDSPGSQGYHGLKGKLDSRFLILDKGGHQIFRTYVYAPESGLYMVEKEGVEPTRILVDCEPLDTPPLRLSKGWHSLVIAYADAPKAEYRLEDKKSFCLDDRQRSAAVFYPESHSLLKDRDPYGGVIASKWYDTEHLPYSHVKGQGKWEYRFMTAPGTERMDLNVKGRIESVTVDGIRLKGSGLKKQSEGSYTVNIDGRDGGIHEVVVVGSPDTGYDGAAFFDRPVYLTCGEGKLKAGNWADAGALKYFSGAIRYKKTVDVPETGYDRVELDLGLVDASCEVSVNGRMTDVLMSTPYRLDITDYVGPGRNDVEVLVYSSLSNHYQSIPSAYRGTPRAGLIGPVSLDIYAPVQ